MNWLKVRSLAEELRSFRRPRDPFALPPGCGASGAGPNLLRKPAKITLASLPKRLQWTTQPFAFNPKKGEIADTMPRVYDAAAGHSIPAAGWHEFKNCDDWLRWRRKQLGFDTRPKARRSAAAIKAADRRRGPGGLRMVQKRRPKPAPVAGAAAASRSEAARKAWKTRRRKGKAK